MIPAPSRRAAICGIDMLHSQNVLRRLVPMILSKAESSIFASGPNAGLIPALHTSVSIRPHLSNVVSTKRCSPSLDDTLQVTARPTWPRLPNSSPPAAPASPLRLDVTPLAPSAAKDSADPPP